MEACADGEETGRRTETVDDAAAAAAAAARAAAEAAEAADGSSGTGGMNGQSQHRVKAVRTVGRSCARCKALRVGCDKKAPCALCLAEEKECVDGGWKRRGQSEGERLQAEAEELDKKRMRPDDEQDADVRLEVRGKIVKADAAAADGSRDRPAAKADGTTSTAAQQQPTAASTSGASTASSAAPASSSSSASSSVAGAASTDSSSAPSPSPSLIRTRSSILRHLLSLPSLEAEAGDQQPRAEEATAPAGVAEPAVLQLSAADVSDSSPPPHFLSDFSHLFPRPPLMSLSNSSIAFLNLWAHFMHSRRHPITGHHLCLQRRSVTAFDVYRAVVEQGGFHRVQQQHLYQTVMAALCLASPPFSPAASTLPGGPPVIVPSPLRPRSFLTDYYTRFLLAFELAYQWEKGRAPRAEAVATATASRTGRRRRRTATAVRNDLLKRLWPPAVHPYLFKERKEGEAAAARRDEAAEEEREDGEALGYVGMSRLKRSLSSGLTAETVSSMNRLLQLSWRVGRRQGGWEEDEPDDDDDGSDNFLIFHFDIVTELLQLLPHQPALQLSVRHAAPHPLLAPLLADTLAASIASSSPPFHTAALVVLHNLSLHPANHHRLAAHTSLLNLLSEAVVTQGRCFLAQEEEEMEEAERLSRRVLLRIMPAVNLLHVVRRDDLIVRLLAAAQACRDAALWTPAAAAAGGEDEDEVEDAELLLSGLIALLTNPHHSSNIPYLVSALPAAAFALLLSLASPALRLPQSVRHLSAQALAFYALSHQSFAEHIAAQGGLSLLLSLMETKGEKEAETRRAAAAALQAIASYCSLGGKGALQWSQVWRVEERIFAACCLDTDVSQLLMPVLQKSMQMQQQQADTARSAAALH